MRRAAIVFALVTLVGAVGDSASAATVAVSFASVNGVGEVVAATPCSDFDGFAAANAAHYRYGGLVSGLPAPLAGTFELDVDVHREVRFDFEGGFSDGGFMEPGPNAFVIGTPRGDLFAVVAAGTCDEPSVDFSGSGDSLRAAGIGTWAVTGGTRSFTGATGGGAIEFDAGLGSGVANTLQAALDGRVDVHQPDVEVTFERAAWRDPIDYLFKQVTAVFTVANSGDGDAYGVRFSVGPNSPAAVETLGNATADIGDLPAGTSRVVAMRFRVPPQLCAPACEFSTTSTVRSTDALDVDRPVVVNNWLVSAPLTPLSLPTFP